MKKIFILLSLLLPFFGLFQSYAQERIVIEHSNFKDSVFISQEDFRNIKFINPVDFTDAHFMFPADFEEARFTFKSDFTRSQFDSTANFNKVKFNSLVSFCLADFSSDANFLGTEFKSVADFKGTKFISKAIFFAAKFESEVEFWRGKIDLRADFASSRFYSTSVFYDIDFNANADFKWATFNDTAEFKLVNFALRADFMETQFDSLVTFIETTFLSTAYFYKSVFDSKANFIMVQFDSTAYFSKSMFNQTAYFERVRFNSETNFDWVQFDSLACFKYSEFNSEVFINNTVLPEYLDLSHITKISNEIDLTTTIINPKYECCYINLTGSSIDKIRFRYNRFRLWFPSGDSIGYEFKANVYEQLLEKQKKEGFTQSYEALDKEYKEFQYIDSESRYSWIIGHSLNWINKKWWGYGYEKWRIIWNVFIIYLLFSFINVFILKHLITRVYVNQKIEKLRISQTSNKWYNRVFNYFWYSLFYTAVIFFGVKFDMDKLKYEENLDGLKRLNLIYFFIIYLGGFVCLAYLANYIITV